MRAVQIANLNGPGDGLRLVEMPEPEPLDPYLQRPGVVIEVMSAGVSFPDLLQSWGRYQLQPELPFVPGSEVAGVVRSAPPGSPVRPGQAVMAYCIVGGFASLAVAPPHLVFDLPERFDYAEGASFVVNYHTAWFGLFERGRLKAGEWVLVHGAAGGVGLAAVQIAQAADARVIAVVSSDEKERAAREGGANHVLRAGGPWREEAVELSGGGIDVVLDPVGGERFKDSLRSLREGGRLVVVGFAAGSIPTVRVHHLLHNNLDVVGAGWGAFTIPKAGAARAAADALEALSLSRPLTPLIARRLPLEQAAVGLRLIEGRAVTGKIVLEVGGTDQA